MPRKASAPASKSNYWEDFLKAQNLIGDITAQMETESEEGTAHSSRKTESKLHPDMIEWSHRVAEALVPLENVYTPDDRKIQIRKREQIRKELTDALTGKADFSEWFDKTKTRFSIRLPEFVQIFYESLEGLRSKEAKELRQQYSEWLERVNRQYTPR